MIAPWPSAPLSDFVDYVTYGFTSPMPITSSGPHLITAKDIVGGRINYASSRRTSIAAFEALTAKSKPRTGDVLLTKDGSIGRVAVCDREGTCINQSVAVMRPNSRIDSDFLSYMLQSPRYQQRMAADADGSTIQHIYITRVNKMIVQVPSLVSEQRAIAAVLKALDDKISANTTLAQTVIELLAAMFDGVVASESEGTTRLATLATFSKGVSYRRQDLGPSRAAMVTLKSVTRDGRYSASGLKPFTGSYRANQRVEPGSIVIAQTDLTQAADVIGRAVRVVASKDYETLVASLDLIVARPLEHVTQEYLLGVVRDSRFREHCRSHTSGTTVLHLQRGAIESYEAPALSSNSQRSYAERSTLLMARMDAANAETALLSQLRDTLLPGLMSGRLSIKDVERPVEDAV